MYTKVGPDIWACTLPSLGVIKLVHTYPPIPMRNMDWVAYVDGEEELGHYGYGRTKEEALQDLVEFLDVPI